MIRHLEPEKMRRLVILLAVGWSAAVLLHLSSAPAYESISSRVVATPHEITGLGSDVVTRSTILEANGPGALVALGFPLVVSAIALGAAFIPSSRLSSRIAGLAGAVVAVFSFTGAMTTGVYYIPVALLLLLGAVLPQRHLFSRA